MQIMWFTERAYHDIPEDEVIKNRSFFGLPNKYFDPKRGADLLNQYIDEKIYSEELGGFDAVMLNEHHGTPFCLGAVMDVEAAILARVTKKVKIVLLGNPIPTVANPLRLAEELAMIDLVSRGRLIPGWVRGAGSEQLANNANPAFNREYFEEGHDLILEAWTRPGPFRFEGKHFHFRFVNPWVKPYQQPHPPIWIPGLVSPDTAIWCAKKRYPYIALATFLEPTTELWSIYSKAAAREGYQAGSENFGYMQPIFVGGNQKHAEEMGKRFLFGGGFAHFARPEWMFPPGYNSKAATQRMARQFANPNLPGKSIMPSGDEEVVDVAAAKQAIEEGYEEARTNLQMIAGTPDHVIPRLKKVIDVLRPGIFSFWLDGPVPAKDRLECLRLLSAEVIPALREHGKKIGIVDPFERKPGSRALPRSGEPEPVSRLEALAS
jgi:alkanesulfonate monooxygenase SsuD/methylene tetrahydromethanopterin reductase-like flavin-dependent oxidoreductase (luciferase family)